MKFLKMKKINKNNLSKIQRLFSICISCDPFIFQEEIKKLYNEIGDQKLWEFAEKEKCQSIIKTNLQNIYPNKVFNQKWIKATENIKNNIGFYMNELDKLSSKLLENNIPVLALKNSGIARGIFRDFACSPMGDIDVLVKPKDFFDAHEKLIELGYEFSDRSPFAINDIKEAFNHGGSEYQCLLPNGNYLWIELQCRSVSGRWIQPDQEPSTEYLFSNSIAIDGSSCRLLSPVDNLLQVCLHTAKHSYVRSPGFRLHTDVDRIVKFNDINWDTFCKKVEDLHIRTPVYLSLLIPKNLLDSGIPDFVLKRLNFSPLKHLFLQNWLINVGLFGPHDKKWSRIGFIIFNCMLYDGLGDFFKALFPEKKFLGVKNMKGKFFFIFYFKRIIDLLFNRSKNI